MSNIKQNIQTHLFQGINSTFFHQDNFQSLNSQFKNQMPQFQNSFIQGKNSLQTPKQNIIFSDHTHFQPKNKIDIKNILMQTGTDRTFSDQNQSSYHYNHQKFISQNQKGFYSIQEELPSDKSYLPSQQNISLSQYPSKSEIQDQASQLLTQGYTNKKTLLQNIDLSHRDQMHLGGKVVSGLQKNIVSLPFRQPVDVVSLNIPDYLQIIKQPMDLRTIKRKLSDDMYQNLNQIYADIQLIIQNSKKYNELNPDFIRLTKNFQKSYFKIKRDCERNMKKVKIQEKKKNQFKQPINILKKAQKKYENKFPSDQFQITSSYGFKELAKLAKRIRKLLPQQQIDLFKRIGIFYTMTIDIKALTTKHVRSLFREVEKMQKSKQQMIKNEEKRENSHLTTCDNNQYRLKR